MKTANVTVMSLAGCLLLAGASMAQPSIEASRYKNAEGIEVLTGRAIPVALAVVGVSKETAPEVSRPGALASAASAPAKLKVDAREQAERDRDRLSILSNELQAEERALQLKRQALRSPRADADLNAVQQQALRDDVARHEENIRALMREIERAVPGRGAAPMAVSFDKTGAASR